MTQSAPSPDVRWIAIGEIEDAINRARAEEPARGPEAALSPDVSRMASVYARLIHGRRAAVAWGELSERERAALERWLR